jgi:hypothetical protein
MPNPINYSRGEDLTLDTVAEDLDTVVMGDPFGDWEKRVKEVQEARKSNGAEQNLSASLDASRAILGEQRILIGGDSAQHTLDSSEKSAFFDQFDPDGTQAIPASVEEFQDDSGPITQPLLPIINIVDSKPANNSKEANVTFTPQKQEIVDKYLAFGYDDSKAILAAESEIKDNMAFKAQSFIYTLSLRDGLYDLNKNGLTKNQEINLLSQYKKTSDEHIRLISIIQDKVPALEKEVSVLEKVYDKKLRERAVKVVLESIELEIVKKQNEIGNCEKTILRYTNRINDLKTRNEFEISSIENYIETFNTTIIGFETEFEQALEELQGYNLN